MPYFAKRRLMMATMNVSLPDPMREWVEDQVKGGTFANASDYIRDLIRHDQVKHVALRAAIQEGLDSGRSPRKAQDIVADAKARLVNG
jgi:antitoxin ParD1/3/4